MSATNGATRCPKCNRFGSPRNGGYCTECKPGRSYQNVRDGETYDGYVGDSYVKDYDLNRPFFSEKFGCIKEKFGYER